MSTPDTPHPVHLVVSDDLRRNRLTVFFRLLLGIPHFIWITLWSVVVVFAAIATWVATLVAGKPPRGLHKFLSAYTRYTVHLNAYLYLVGNPYPGFVGEEGEYPVDVTLPEPAPQARWKTLVRIFLVIPALLLSASLSGFGGPGRLPARGRNATFSTGGGALTLSCAILGWFAILARGRMPKGLRDAGAYGIGYGAQVLAYLLFVTDRYPNADPTAMLQGVERPPEHPVHLVGEAHDLRRSRVTVFFRFPLALPHIVWLLLWSIPTFFVAIFNWFATLVSGRPSAPFHRFLSRYVRYQLHVYAFLYLAANPFPGFVGEPGSYPLDLELPPRGRQNRWKTGFRIVLAIPAFIVNSALGGALLVAAVLTWFAALARGQAPWGLRNLLAYGLRYAAQANAYLLLLTDAYPHASPLEGAAPALVAADEAE
ncbi:MAG TPA: DUF4389 domain-containing protein [Gaiellaceae bacterium]|nr:DUF4389 domain-containing protein [Gaiellaceae bacterium]